MTKDVGQKWEGDGWLVDDVYMSVYSSFFT